MKPLKKHPKACEYIQMARTRRKSARQSNLNYDPGNLIQLSRILNYGTIKEMSRNCERIMSRQTRHINVVNLRSSSFGWFTTSPQKTTHGTVKEMPHATEYVNGDGTPRYTGESQFMYKAANT